MALTATGTWQDRNNINAICDGVVSALASAQNQGALQDLLGQYPSLQTVAPSTTFQQVKAAAGRQGQSYDPLNMAQRQQAEGMLSGLISSLAAVPISGMEGGSAPRIGRPILEKRPSAIVT